MEIQILTPRPLRNVFVTSNVWFWNTFDDWRHWWQMNTGSDKDFVPLENKSQP